MVPRARMTQRWPLRPWRSQRKLYVVIYRGALRRRIRRLVRSRFFNNARTATRNLDLPLAIGDPHLLTVPPTASVDSGQCRAATTAGFFGIRRCAGGGRRLSELGADMDFYGLKRAPLYPQTFEFT